MEFDLQTLQQYQVYGFLIVGGFCAFMLYAYIFHIYRSEKKGLRDYEKFSNIVLDDEVDSTPIQKVSPWEEKKIKGDKA